MDHKILALGGDGIGPEVLDFGLHLIYKIPRCRAATYCQPGKSRG